DGKPECAGGRQIDDQLDLCRLHDRQIRGLSALYDAAGIDAELTKRIRNVGSVAHQPARRSQLLPSPTLGERSHGSLTRLSVPARGSSAADLTTRYIPSRTPSLETDSVGKSHRAPTPGPDTVVAWHSCSCR